MEMPDAWYLMSRTKKFGAKIATKECEGGCYANQAIFLFWPYHWALSTRCHKKNATLIDFQSILTRLKLNIFELFKNQKNRADSFDRVMGLLSSIWVAVFLGHPVGIVIYMQCVYNLTLFVIWCVFLGISGIWLCHLKVV